MNGPPAKEADRGTVLTGQRGEPPNPVFRLERHLRSRVAHKQGPITTGPC